MKKAELAAAVAAARHSSSPPEAHPAEDSLADKVSAMERRASSLAEQLHYKVCTCTTNSYHTVLIGLHAGLIWVPQCL